MYLQVVSAHRHIGIFKTFKKGSQVDNITACQQYAGWVYATIDGKNCYVYQSFIKNNRLICDYNPTELDVCVGEVVELLGVYQDWAWVKKDKQTGWLPCACLRTLDDEIKFVDNQ